MAEENTPAEPKSLQDMSDEELMNHSEERFNSVDQSGYGKAHQEIKSRLAERARQEAARASRKKSRAEKLYGPKDDD